MNKIEKLINALCPDGVEFLPLWKLTKWDTKFKGVDKYKQDITIKVRHVSAQRLKELLVENGNIRLLSTGKFDGYTTKNIATDYLNYGEIISIPTGGSANLKYFNGYYVDGGNNICQSIDSSKYNLKFIYYFLLNINDYIQSCYRGGSVQHPEMYKILNVEVPVPPLPIQEEIVRILDSFTELIAELTSELKDRKKQYEYYCDMLLTFAENDLHFSKQTIYNYDEIKKLQCKYGYISLSIDELFDVKNGYTPSKDNNEYWDNGTLPWFRLEDINENGRILNDSIQHITSKALKKSGLFKKDSLIITTSATIGEYALIKQPFLCNQRFTVLSLKDNYRNILNPKFGLYYCHILSKYCKDNLNVGNFASVDMIKFSEFEFKIPSLEEQERIVSILDKFDKYCNDTSEGLPAEIKYRQQQYEYYRDKLLTFKRLED